MCKLWSRSGPLAKASMHALEYPGTVRDRYATKLRTRLRSRCSLPIASSLPFCVSSSRSSCPGSHQFSDHLRLARDKLPKIARANFAQVWHIADRWPRNYHVKLFLRGVGVACPTGASRTRQVMRSEIPGVSILRACPVSSAHGPSQRRKAAPILWSGLQASYSYMQLKCVACSPIQHCRSPEIETAAPNVNQR